jgi:hypothetical protein
MAIASSPGLGEKDVGKMISDAKKFAESNEPFMPFVKESNEA